jgi:hypothetical protein
VHLIGALPLLGVQLNAVSLVNLTMVRRGARRQLDMGSPEAVAPAPAAAGAASMARHVHTRLPALACMDAP